MPCHDAVGYASRACANDDRESHACANDDRVESLDGANASAPTLPPTTMMPCREAVEYASRACANDDRVDFSGGADSEAPWTASTMSLRFRGPWLVGGGGWKR